MTRIKFPLVCEARHILDMVKNSFNNIEEFHALCYGKPIEVAQANDLVQEYIRLCGISDILLEFTTDLSCNARLLTRKHSTKAYKKKKINLIINEDSESNQSYLRELGILCLSDHEIGTHYCRFTNDHKQLWHNARKNFGLSPLVDYQIRRTEEGLATINGIINANVPLLFRTALSYYVAYLMHQHTMSYVLELIQPYIANQAEGVKMCQRCLRNSKLNKIPIHAYFDGAVDILRNIDKIDFTLLMSGKISVSDARRLRFKIQRDKIEVPKFMKNLETYRTKLRYIAEINGLIPCNMYQLFNLNLLNVVDEYNTIEKD